MSIKENSSTATVQDLRKVLAEIIPDAPYNYNRSDEVYPAVSAANISYLFLRSKTMIRSFFRCLMLFLMKISGIIIGDAATAKDIVSLRAAGVTHILNSAYEPKIIGMVTTNADYYKKKNFKCTFCGIAAIDMPAYPLIRHFDEAAEFIEQALKANGKCYVHCFMVLNFLTLWYAQGVSRSSTLVIAFLMLNRNMRAIDALRLVRNHRPIVRPNEGFLYQLCELDKRLNG